MKDSASNTFSFLRFTVFVLLLISCIPLTLITRTGAAASSLSGAGPRGADVSNAASLTNCRVISSTLGGEMLAFLQHSLSTLVIEVNDGKVIAECQASFPDGVSTAQTLFQMSGKENLAGYYLQGTWTLAAEVGPLKARYNGNFKSEDVRVKNDGVTVHFWLTDEYWIGKDGGKSPPTEGVTTGSFDAVFTPEGFAYQNTPAPSTDTNRYKEAVFSGISGRVEYLPPGADPETGWRYAKFESELRAGTLIRTGEDSTAIFSFGDMSTFILKPEAAVMISYPPEKDSKIGLLMGKMWGNFKSMIKDGSMEMETTQIVTAIKGTTFVIETNGTSSTVKVIEGSIEVTSKANGKKVMVEGGKMVTATKSGLGAKTSFNTATEQSDWNKVRSGTASSPKPTQPSTTKSSSSGRSSCFIATAAYGSATAPQLDTLRAFRDKVLLQSEAGTWLVETYYYLSPPLADFIADKDALRWIVSFELLDPIVFILKNSQQAWNN